MKPVKSLDGVIRFVPLSANQPLLLPATGGSQPQNIVVVVPVSSASSANNQEGILLFILQ